MGAALERRELAFLCSNPSEISSAHLYSDGSPVTGTEIQGMVMEIIMITSIVYTFVLPAAALQYGFCRTIDKAVALMWALWIITGDKRLFMIIWNAHGR
jgi:hypothetical protein